MDVVLAAAVRRIFGTCGGGQIGAPTRRMVGGLYGAVVVLVVVVVVVMEGGTYGIVDVAHGALRGVTVLEVAVFEDGDVFFVVSVFCTCGECGCRAVGHWTEERESEREMERWRQGREKGVGLFDGSEGEHRRRWEKEVEEGLKGVKDDLKCRWAPGG